MKRTVGVAISLLLVASTLFAQAKSLDKNNAYYVYLKGTNTKITDEEYLNYAKVVEKDTYDKYINDEFEWEEQFGLLKEKFNKSIQDADLEAEYSIVTSVEFGDYNFTNEGFPVSIGEGTFFPFDTFYYDYKASAGSLFKKAVAFKLDSFEKYNFFAMPKSDAKSFLQGRKYSDGSVNSVMPNRNLD